MFYQHMENMKEKQWEAERDNKGRKNRKQIRKSFSS